jgi:hypothetical protein
LPALIYYKGVHLYKDPLQFTLGVIGVLLVASTALFILGFVLNFASIKTRSVLSGFIGHKTFLLLFCPGIVIHEFGHWVAAHVFLHQPVETKWLDLEAADGSHGYVQMQRRAVPRFLYILPMWQMMGELFIGVAPLVIGPLFLFICFRYLVPGGSSFIHHPTLHTLPAITPRLLMWSYFSIATIAHVELSSADLKGTWKGFFVTLLFTALWAFTYAKIIY